MTYGILDLESGNFIYWHESADEAAQALSDAHRLDPEAVDSIVLVEFDDEGMPV